MLLLESEGDITPVKSYEKSGNNDTAALNTYIGIAITK